MEIQSAVVDTLVRLEKADLLPTNAEWQTLKELALILKPFANATRMIEGEKYVTLSFVWPLFGNLYHFLINGKSAVHPFLPNWGSLTPQAQAIRTALINELSKPNRFSAPSRPMVFASILDVRYHQLLFAPAADRLRHFSEFKAYGRAYFADHHLDVAGAPPAHDIMYELFDQERKDVALLTFDQETDKYLQVDNLPQSQDPLDWWALNQKFFPRLAILARMFLCIPCTSAPSERLFSHLNLVVSKKRTRMLPIRVEKHAMLRFNMIQNPAL